MAAIQLAKRKSEAVKLKEEVTNKECSGIIKEDVLDNEVSDSLYKSKGEEVRGADNTCRKSQKIKLSKGMKRFLFKQPGANNKVKNTLVVKAEEVKKEDNNNLLNDQPDIINNKNAFYQTYGTAEESKMLKNQLLIPIQTKNISIPSNNTLTSVSEHCIFQPIDEEVSKEQCMDDEIMNTRLRDIPLIGSISNLEKDIEASCETGRFPNCDEDSANEELIFEDESDTNRMTFGNPNNNEICINIKVEDIHNKEELTPLKKSNRSETLEERESSVMLKSSIEYH